MSAQTPFAGSKCIRNPNSVGSIPIGYWNGGNDGNNGNAQASVYLSGGNEFGASGDFYGDVLCRMTTASATVPTCYAARIDSGVGLQLFKVIAGTYTQIGSTVGDNTTFVQSGNFYQLTLRCNGSTISVKVLDTVANKYLTAGATWVSDTSGLVRAISLTNTAIASGTPGTAGMRVGFGGMFTHMDNFSFDTVGAGWEDIQRTPTGTQASNSPGGGGSHTVDITVFNAEVVSNNLVAVCFWGRTGSDQTAPNLRVVDANTGTTNTYTNIAFAKQTLSGPVYVWAAIFLARIVNATTPNGFLQVTCKAFQTDGVTANNPTSGGAHCACALELASGSTTLDGTAVGAGSTTGAPQPGTLSSTVSNDLILACLSSDGQSITITEPTGFINLNRYNAVSHQDGQGCYKIVSGAYSANPSWTLSDATNPFACVQVAVKQVGSSTGKIFLHPFLDAITTGGPFFRNPIG